MHAIRKLTSIHMSELENGQKMLHARMHSASYSMLGPLKEENGIHAKWWRVSVRMFNR